MTIRTIEITAKSENEATQLAKEELNDNEKIIETQTVSAPAKGIFGFVGKQEYKIKFVIEQTEKSDFDFFDEEGSDSTQPEEKYEFSDDTDDYEYEVSDVDFSDDSFETSERSETSEMSPNKSFTSTYEKKYKKRRTTPKKRDKFHLPTISIPETIKEEVTEEIKAHPCYDSIYSFITEIAANLGINDIKFEEYMTNGIWVIEASCENISQLIGKRGRTLDSIQYLMSIILNKGREDKIKLIIDAQGYRDKRYKNLLLLANRMCRKVFSSKRPVELEAMSTLDRKTIHLALKNCNGIQTFSKGTEPNRRVVIAPLRKRSRPQDSTHNPEPEYTDHSPDEFSMGTSVPMFSEENV